MINYTIRRLLSAIPTLIIVAVMVFFLIRCVPGNPALTLLSDDATVEEIAAMEAKMGLDQPVPVQFVKWVGNAVRGDFGSSIYYDEPAMGVVMSRLESTWMLVIMAMFFSILIGVPLGITAAVHRNGLLDKMCMVLSMIGISMPGFWLALNLVILFAIKNTSNLFSMSSFSYAPFVISFFSLAYVIAISPFKFPIPSCRPNSLH